MHLSGCEASECDICKILLISSRKINSSIYMNIFFCLKISYLVTCFLIIYCNVRANIKSVRPADLLITNKNHISVLFSLKQLNATFVYTLINMYLIFNCLFSLEDMTYETVWNYIRKHTMLWRYIDNEWKLFLSHNCQCNCQKSSIVCVNIYPARYILWSFIIKLIIFLLQALQTT